MNIFLFILVFVYITVIIYVTRLYISNFEEKLESESSIIDDRLGKLSKERNYILIEKKKLETEAAEIFTLYELTKDVAKSLKEAEAYKIFERKLRDNISFKESRFIEPLSKEVRKIKISEEYYSFSLKSKRRNLGLLAIKGLNEEDKEKLTILAHQFALSLRRIKLYQELERLAITDSLTQLFNRRYFWERFEEELSRAKIQKIDLSFLMIDVDHFKKYNDKYGHLTGDQILSEVGVIIRDNIREIDIAGRFGGEEFCVVLPDTQPDGAKYVAERIRSTAESNPVKAYDATVKISVSIGISTYPKDGKETEEILDKADWALYRAKKLGRNKVCAFGLYEK